MSTAPIKWFTGRDDDANADWLRAERWLENYGVCLGEYSPSLIAHARRPAGGWLFRIEGPRDGDDAVIVDAEISYDADFDGERYVDCSQVISVTIRRADQ